MEDPKNSKDDKCCLLDEDYHEYAGIEKKLDQLVQSVAFYLATEAKIAIDREKHGRKVH